MIPLNDRERVLKDFPLAFGYHDKFDKQWHIVDPHFWGQNKPTELGTGENEAEAWCHAALQLDEKS